MIAPLTRVAMSIDAARDSLGVLNYCLKGPAEVKALKRHELYALEKLKAQIVTDGLLAQAETASARCIAARRIPPTEF